MVGSKHRQLNLHEQERPIALLSSLIANQNRDPKKNRDPFTMDQFCQYKPREAMNLPSYMYGSAGVAAVERGLMPSWALFCYKALASSASSNYTPKKCIMTAEDAVLLHPIKTEEGWKGMLIAMESAGGKYRNFVTEDGETIRLAVPPLHTKFVAQEDVTLS